MDETKSNSEMFNMLMNIKQDIGAIKTEQSNLSRVVNDLSEIFHAQIRHDEKLISLDKELKALKEDFKETQKDKKVCIKEEFLKSSEKNLDEKIKDNKQEIEKVKNIMIKVGFGIITALCAIAVKAFVFVK